MRDHPVEGPPRWKTTLLRGYPFCENTLLKTTRWEIILLKAHPVKRPPCWENTLLKTTWWETTLLKDHLLRECPVKRPPDERPPCWNERPPWWETIPLLRPLFHKHTASYVFIVHYLGESVSWAETNWDQSKACPFPGADLQQECAWSDLSQ